MPLKRTPYESIITAMNRSSILQAASVDYSQFSEPGENYVTYNQASANRRANHHDHGRFHRDDSERERSQADHRQPKEPLRSDAEWLQHGGDRAWRSPDRLH